MIVEGLAVATLIKTFYSANKSLEMEEKALKRYAKAFEREKEAELLVEKKAEYTDKRLANVAKKKRAIIKNTVPRFIEVYGKIQKIEQNKTNENSCLVHIDKLEVLNTISLSVKKDFTDKELVCGLIIKGFGKMMEMDSERYLSAANNQMRVSNVVYSQAELIGEIYDAIVKRADRIANLLMTMNALFVGVINKTEEIIKKNGSDIRNYNKHEKEILMTCANVASAVSDIINVPVVDENGNLCELAIEMIEKGENFLEKMNEVIYI